MPITFDCECGKQLRVADEFAGKRAKCPSCETVTTVPTGAADGPPTEPAPRTARRAAEPDEDRPRFGKRRLTEDGSAAGRTAKDGTAAKARSLEGNLANSGIAGGIAVMVAAVVWFVVGLVFFDWIAFYPPVLFVVGLVGFIKGLVAYGNRDD